MYEIFIIMVDVFSAGCDRSWDFPNYYTKKQGGFENRKLTRLHIHMTGNYNKKGRFGREYHPYSFQKYETLHIIQ